ncbi:hypothetical protein KUTeg_016541 [Tegillarca granosa]|uniref:methylcrotonoyl-CoA carboxylase n=1 Tax=Tegillarca granosa TaxID=220873 RepID=A0ABQ9EQ08_TEGGR|nr:hypothetical protein KUTeg_016541 [Tegillarca granosa]
MKQGNVLYHFKRHLHLNTIPVNFRMSNNRIFSSRVLHYVINKRRFSIQAKKLSSKGLPFCVMNAAIEKDETFHKNSEWYKVLLEKHSQMLNIAFAGGGEKATLRHQKQNKMLVMDRIKALLDDDSDFFEVATLGGLAMEYGNVPRASIIGGVGRIHGKLCMIIANESTVKAGTVYPITLKKQLRCQEIAEQNRLPTVNVVESGGAFLPLQAEIFPDKTTGGRVFYNIANLGSQNIHQIAIVCGSCTAGGAYVPTMCDDVVIVHKNGTIFLGGPPLVQAATGEIVTAEELGGATMHSSVSGCTDYFAENETEAFLLGRELVAALNLTEYGGRTHKPEDPLYDPAELQGLISKDNNIDIYKVGEVTGNKLRAHVKMMASVSCAVVPKITFIIGNSIGPVSHVMGSRSMSPNFLFCWPNAVIGMNEPKEMIQALCQENFSNSQMTDEEKTEAKTKITEKIIRETSSFYAASRLWNDGIVLPEDTRKVIQQCLNIVTAYRKPRDTQPAFIRM